MSNLTNDRERYTLGFQHAAEGYDPQAGMAHPDILGDAYSMGYRMGARMRKGGLDGHATELLALREMGREAYDREPIICAYTLGEVETRLRAACPPEEREREGSLGWCPDGNHPGAGWWIWDCPPVSTTQPGARAMYPAGSLPAYFVDMTHKCHATNALRALKPVQG